MKKLIILASAIILGMVANAASYSWSWSGKMVMDPTTGKTLTTTDTNKAIATLYAASYTDVLGTGALATSTFSSGGFGTSNLTLDFGGVALPLGETVDFYVVLTVEDGSDVYTYTSATKSSAGVDALATDKVTFSSFYADTKDADNWVKTSSGNVPEPTSGLLLLIGVGALALRRKDM